MPCRARLLAERAVGCARAQRPGAAGDHPSRDRAEIAVLAGKDPCVQGRGPPRRSLLDRVPARPRRTSERGTGRLKRASAAALRPHDCCLATGRYRWHAAASLVLLQHHPASFWPSPVSSSERAIGSAQPVCSRAIASAKLSSSAKRSCSSSTLISDVAWWRSLSRLCRLA